MGKAGQWLRWLTWVLKKHCLQMRQKMINTHERPASHHREGLGELQPHQQGADETRPRGHGDARELGRRQASPEQRFPDNWYYVQYMVSRGQLGHHSAILMVDGDLGGHDIGKDPATSIHDSSRGLVAGAFDAEHRSVHRAPYLMLSSVCLTQLAHWQRGQSVR